MLPSSKTKGNIPVRLWYMRPLVLLANAPKQKTLATESVLFKVSKVWLCVGPITIAWGTWETGMIGILAGVVVASTFSHILRIPWRGCFMCPLAVAGLRLRYLLIKSLLMFGHPFKKPRCIAFKRVDIGGLHNNWCANLTVMACEANQCWMPGEVGGTTFIGAESWQESVSWGGLHPFSWDRKCP